MHSFLSKKSCISGLSHWFEVIPSSLHAPRKLVPQSDLSCFTGPRIELNRHKVLMKLDDSIDSIWMALVPMQVKMTAQRLLLARFSTFSTFLMRTDSPGSENIDANISKWCTDSYTVNWYVRHLLGFCVPSQFATFDAVVDDGADAMFSANKP